MDELAFSRQDSLLQPGQASALSVLRKEKTKL